MCSVGGYCMNLCFWPSLDFWRHVAVTLAPQNLLVACALIIWAHKSYVGLCLKLCLASLVSVLV